MLRLRDVHIARGGIPLLTGVNFAVPAGQALILRGANGLGKTSLLRAIMGLAPVTAGVIDTDEEPGFAGHADALKTSLTAAENLVFWARYFGGGDVAKALECFDLRDLADRPAGRLSAGQKRRLGLARLLVTGRRLWVLDEPTVSLDHDSVARFITALRDHLAGGGAALLSTHIDLGLPAETLDLTPFKADPVAHADFDEAFL